MIGFKEPAMESIDGVRAEWIAAVDHLVDDVESWCRENDWPTRRIEKTMTDRWLGSYDLPSLIFQINHSKFMLEPVAKFVFNADGVVDLYCMPEYDDVASFFLVNGRWYGNLRSSGEAISEDVKKTHADTLATSSTVELTKPVFDSIVRNWM